MFLSVSIRKFICAKLHGRRTVIIIRCHDSFEKNLGAIKVSLIVERLSKRTLNIITIYIKNRSLLPRFLKSLCKPNG